MDKKIVLLGGGSNYFEKVIGEFCVTPDLEGVSVVLYDIDEERMNLIKAAGDRIIEKTGANIKLSATTELGRALDGADFAISSIGVHGRDSQGLPSWHMIDQEICKEFGIIHTTGDSVGPAGISQGLRIIPVYLEIAEEMAKRCPDVILLNHSNPMSPICRSVIKAHGINTVGYCHNILGSCQRLAELLEVPLEELETIVTGPNHMNWLLELRHKGKDLYPLLKEKLKQKEEVEGKSFETDILRTLDVYPIGGDRHMIEFFPFAREASQEEELKYGLKWRGTQQRKIIEEISDNPNELPDRAAGNKPPKIPETLSPESMGEQIRAMTSGREKVHYVNTTNHTAVPNLPPWSVIELKALIGSQGARPVYAGELPSQAARWSLATIHAHELLVDAAIEKSRQKAIMALACDPMITNLNEPVQLLDALVEAHGDRLADFKKTESR